MATETKESGRERMLKLADIHPGKTIPNPRKRFDPDKLKELAASITEHGILQPLVVRSDGNGAFDLVCGERRWRAAKMAKLDLAPCVVRPLTDAEAREIQLIENGQREDITAIEEAETFAELIASKAYTADTLAAKIGKSRSHVYGRLKLVALQGPARAAVEAGELDPTKAALVAQVSGETAQKEILEYATGKGDSAWDGPASFRDLKQTIERDYQKNLRGCAWKLDDAALLPKAGACSACPKRAADRPNVCMDVACYADKLKAHGARRLAEAKAAGQEILGEGALRGERWVQLEEECYWTEGQSKPWRELIGKQSVEIALVNAERGVIEVVARDAAMAAAKKNGVKFYHEGGGGSTGASRTARKKQILDDKILDARISAAVAKCEATAPTLDLWHLIATSMLDSAWSDAQRDIARRRGWEKGYNPKKLITAMNLNQVRGLLLELLVLRGLRGFWNVQAYANEAMRFYKIDGAKIAAQVKAAEQAKKPKAKKKEGKKGKSK